MNKMNQITRTTLKPYTVHIFNPNVVNRTEKSLEKVMDYSNQPVIITEIHQYQDNTQYTVIPAYTPTECEFKVRSDELWHGRPMKLGRRNNYKLFSSDIFQFDIDELKEEYAECYDDVEPTDDELYSMAYEMLDNYFSDFMDEIQRYENIHGKSEYIVLADLGRWDGRYDGGKIILGMEEVIRKCCEGLDDYEICFQNGQLHIKGCHHDGCNSFAIRELKDGSADYIMNHEYDTEPRDLHRHLFSSSRWSMRVKMFDILGYGGGIY